MSNYLRSISAVITYLEASAKLALNAAEELRQLNPEHLNPEKADAPAKQSRPYKPRLGRRRPNSNRGRVRSWSTQQRVRFSTVDAAAALPDIPLPELRDHLAVLVKLRELQRVERGMYVAA